VTIFVRELGLVQSTFPIITIGFIEFSLNCCCLRHPPALLTICHLHLPTKAHIGLALSIIHFYYWFPRDREVLLDETKQQRADG
jgi:hypothetical protein